MEAKPVIHSIASLAEFARKCGVEYISVYPHSATRTLVSFRCNTDDDVAQMFGTLVGLGAVTERPLKTMSTEFHSWLDVTVEINGMSISIFGPQRAVTQEAA